MTRPTAVALTLLAALAWAGSAAAQDGYADPTFSGDGLQIVGWGGDSGWPSAVRALGDGSLNVGGDGLAELVFDTRLWINALEVQSDGKPIGVGLINVSIPGTPDFFLFRLNANGSLDPTFHANGVRRVTFEQDPDLSDYATAMALSGGRLVAVGQVTVEPDASFGITRTTSALVFRDGFERSSTGGWGGN